MMKSNLAILIKEECYIIVTVDVIRYENKHRICDRQCIHLVFEEKKAVMILMMKMHNNMETVMASSRAWLHSKQ